MKARLFSQWGAAKGTEFLIGEEATIGRGEENTIRLAAKPVSNRHARIFFDPETLAYFLEDLGSMNGTELDGTRVTRPERLGRLHTIRFAGAAEFMFVELDLAPAPASAAVDAADTADTADTTDSNQPAGGKTLVDQEISELPAALRDADIGAPGAGEETGGTQVEKMPIVLPQALAETNQGEEAGGQESGLGLAVFLENGTRRFELREGENLVGRSRSATVRLSSREFSRRHAVITIKEGRITVRDEGSRNQTYLDNQKVEGEVEASPQQVLRFGRIEARLIARGQEEDTLLPATELPDGDDE